jgi:hypothetical protein
MDCAHHLQLQEHAPVLMLTMPQILKMRDAKRFVASAAVSKRSARSAGSEAKANASSREIVSFRVMRSMMG